VTAPVDWTSPAARSSWFTLLWTELLMLHNHLCDTPQAGEAWDKIRLMLLDATAEEPTSC
jgi:hypothetical protein